MFKGGQYTGSQFGQPTAYLETSADPGYEVTMDTTHIVYAYYTSETYYWYDPYGYDLVMNTGEPYEEIPDYTIYIWPAPIVVTTVITQIVGDQQSAASMRAPGTPVDFQLSVKAFIPPLYVDGPEGYCVPSPWLAIYAGDNRSYSRASLAYRGYQFVTLLPQYGGIVNPQSLTGITERYASDAIAPNGQTLYKDTVLHDCYLLDNQGQASSTGMSVNVTQPQSNVMTANFNASIGNPLEPPGFTPTITWGAAVQVSQTNPNAPTYAVSGAATCYPAFEVYIDGQLIYGYTPPSNSVGYLAACLGLSPGLRQTVKTLLAVR
ncbi:MAG TPA: hypothetical protein VKV17_08085 [Bryobacteraceae bacterium]|nr:hypothetical protein [Bryobacteraceae bacterium]